MKPSASKSYLLKFIQLNLAGNLHVKDQFHFLVDIGIVDLEHAVGELPQVNVSGLLEVQYRIEPLCDDSGELGVLKKRT